MTPAPGKSENARVGKGMTVAERIHSRIQTQRDGCWLWTGATRAAKSARYGHISVRGKMILVHRAAYEAFKGPIPTGLTVDHVCRNTLCCNPAHLDAVTLRENVLRGVGFSGINFRKAACKRGHPFNEENTRHARRIRAGNEERGRVCRTCHRERCAIRRREDRALKDARTEGEK